MDAPMISIENLTKSYGRTLALNSISFEVPRGQVVGFLGPNGAGKSTTMKILTGYVEASGGTVRVGGVDVAQDPVSARKKIGYLPENNPLYEEMMVQEYLEYTADIRQLEKSARQGRIQSAVERCGIGDVRSKDIGELSKGFRQRVGLAQAILHDPDLLILDEPTTGLDPNQVVEIRNLIRELGTEKTVIMSTHVLPEVQHTCSRALIISAGKLVADGPPATLTTDGDIIEVVVAPRQYAGASSQTSDDVQRILSAVTGVEDVHAKPAPEPGTFAFTLAAKGDPRHALFDVIVENKLVLLALERRHVSLEETFRKLTKQLV